VAPSLLYSRKQLLWLVNRIQAVSLHAPVVSIITWKSEVHQVLRCWPCSTCYAAIQINNCLKRTCSHSEIYKRFPLQMDAITLVLQHHRHRKVLVNPWRMHCMQRHGKWHLATSNKARSLSDCQVWRHQTGSLVSWYIRYTYLWLVSQSVSRKFQVLIQFCSNFLKTFQVDLKACLV